MEDEEAFLYGEGDAVPNPEPAAISGEGAAPDPDDATHENVQAEAGDPNAGLPEASADEPQNTEDTGAPSQDNVGAVDDDAERDDDDEDDSEDDDVQITIDQGKIEEAKTSYQNFGLNKSVRQLPTEKKGKFGVEEFDQVGTIDGTPAHEVEIEAIEDKPWRKPGADLTDYFNYGFTEVTWQAYCTRQRKLRNESGVGMPGDRIITSHHNPKTSNGNIGMVGAGASGGSGGAIPTLGQPSTKRPPPVIHSAPPPPTLSQKVDSSPTPSTAGPPPPSGISVMTSDKRNFSKKMFENVDFSVPPPGMSLPPPGLPPPNFPPPSVDDFDPHKEENYYGGGYEPTQESQWVAPPSSYVGGGPPPNSDAPPGDAAYDGKRDPWERNGSNSGARRTSRDSPHHRRRRTRSRSRERQGHYRDRSERDYRDREAYRDRRDRSDRDRDRDRDRERDRDRDRDRSERRSEKRSRSGSKSPRSRESRSPSGHKHKKSKKDRKERGERPDREIKKEIKNEPEDYNE